MRPGASVIELDPWRYDRGPFLAFGGWVGWVGGWVGKAGGGGGGAVVAGVRARARSVWCRVDTPTATRPPPHPPCAGKLNAMDPQSQLLWWTLVVCDRRAAARRPQPYPLRAALLIPHPRCTHSPHTPPPTLASSLSTHSRCHLSTPSRSRPPSRPPACLTHPPEAPPRPPHPTPLSQVGLGAGSLRGCRQGPARPLAPRRARAPAPCGAGRVAAAGGRGERWGACRSPAVPRHTRHSSQPRAHPLTASTPPPPSFPQLIATPAAPHPAPPHPHPPPPHTHPTRPSATSACTVENTLRGGAGLLQYGATASWRSCPRRSCAAATTEGGCGGAPKAAHPCGLAAPPALLLDADSPPSPTPHTHTYYAHVHTPHWSPPQKLRSLPPPHALYVGSLLHYCPPPQLVSLRTCPPPLPPLHYCPPAQVLCALLQGGRLRRPPCTAPHPTPPLVVLRPQCLAVRCPCVTLAVPRAPSTPPPALSGAV